VAVARRALPASRHPSRTPMSSWVSALRRRGLPTPVFAARIFVWTSLSLTRGSLFSRHRSKRSPTTSPPAGSLKSARVDDGRNGPTGDGDAWPGLETRVKGR
jgi:hypothetical protein